MTQLEAARKGIITSQMEEVARKEGRTPEEIRALVAEGAVVIPANRNHSGLSACGIGRGLRTKVNVNLGISPDCRNHEVEFAKAELAERLGANALMDLSCEGDTRPFRKALIARTRLPVGTVPIYDAEGMGKSLEDLTADDFLSMLARHAEDGVDFVTLHAGITRECLDFLEEGERIMPVVSRGGSLIAEWMRKTGEENPFYACFDRVLDICREYDVTISLGDACRPGAVHDATDSLQIQELITLGRLVKRARKAGVQVMVEGPGHMRLPEIEANILLQKKLCHGAPFYVLGPVVTDVAPGYDHITSAIGGALAAWFGADFLCYVTPAEHVRLPTLEDVREGIIAARIAAHAADLAKGIPGAEAWDRRMSEARGRLDWDAMMKEALDSEKPSRMRAESVPGDPRVCTMCGRMCSIKRMQEAAPRP
ncbi:phosphomethylpyrimidine synthase ThiC [Spirochaeta thermophila]|uniref:Phosphomethylpyrimidine synthase n=1 Tax=Winmispira thermophila (strain ATCC 49972 / DSM 6192 / RI 19.B1) TaxID=665571 RepID=E0RNB9_WINT6|nr:phosphomethylpyrimidine synthase ThiC [Spirochaeta thermophila]ADN01119.1 thiamine biosynthesis protein ThiC [Spirochaeta thermophila DSM 6192]